MNSLRNFVHECLVETSGGRKADQLAKKVMRVIISRLKSGDMCELISKKKNAETVIDEEDVPELANAVDYVRLNFDFISGLDMQEVSSEAAFVSSPLYTYIEVDISFPAGRPFRLVDLEDVYPELLENVRHELEHARQVGLTGAASTDKLDTPEKLKEYFLEQAEVEAHVSGFMARAKAKKVSFSSVLDDFLDKLAEEAQDAGVNDDDTDDTVALIRDTYIAYAKKRYQRMK